MAGPTTAEPQAPEQKSNRAALFIVFFVVFIDLLGFGIVLPLLPIFGRDYLEEIAPAKKESPPSARAEVQGAQKKESQLTQGSNDFRHGCSFGYAFAGEISPFCFPIHLVCS